MKTSSIKVPYLSNAIISMFGFFLLLSCNKPNSTYNICDYGAKPNQKCTESIQKAINTCSNNGGGTVLIPSGTYISGTLKILSNVRLFLESGAILKGSTDTADYRAEGQLRGMLYAMNAKNIAICGFGEINGNGTYFMQTDKPHTFVDYDTAFVRQRGAFMANETYQEGPCRYLYRPGMLCVLMNCEDVVLDQITFRDSPEWTVRIANCENVKINGVTIQNNLLVPNSDGIHMTVSRNVVVSNCNLFCGDDAIIVSGFDNAIGVHNSSDQATETQKFGNKTGIAENIVVTNCNLQSRSAGIRIGYGTHTIRNVSFNAINIFGSNRGIGIFTRDTASIQNVSFSNFNIQCGLITGSWWGKGEPIHVSAITYDSTWRAGKIRDIRFTNFTINTDVGAVVYAEDPDQIEGITFNNVVLNLSKSKHAATYGGNFDLRPTLNRNKSLFEHDIPALYFKNTRNAWLKDVAVRWQGIQPDYHTHAIEMDSCRNTVIDGFSGSEASASNPNAFAIKITGGNARIKNSVSLLSSKKLVAAAAGANVE